MTTAAQDQVVIRCEFPDTPRYHAKYQRNNKRTGLKNLRCYPYCGPDEKHHENGFCGAAMRINVSSTQHSGAYSLDRLRAWGEFASHAHANIAGANTNGTMLQAPQPRFPVGSVFSQQDINSILRTDGMHLNPLFEASSNDSAFPQYRQFSFESQKKGWHYDWKGNKYTSDLPHAFTIYIAAPLDANSGMFHCLAVFSSPEFTMFCRRRHKTVSEAEKTQMATAVDEARLRVQHALNADGRIAITSTASTGLLPPPPPPPPLPAAAAAPKKKRASSSSTTGSSPGKRTKSQPPQPKHEPMSPLSQIPPPPPPLPIAMMSMHHQLSISPCNSMPPTPIYINSTPINGRFEFGACDGTPANTTMTSPMSGVKLKTILAAIQNLDKLRKLNQNKVTSREEAEELFNSFEKLDGNWIDAIFSGPFNDQGLLDDFNSSLRDVSTDAFLLNLGEVDLGQIIEVLEALGKHLVEEDRFTDTIHETARTNTMTFEDCMLMISNGIQSFLLAEFHMTVDQFYSNLSGHASTAVDLNPEERNQAMESAFDTLVQAATSNQAAFSSSSSLASSPPVVAAAAAGNNATVSTPLTQFEIKFPAGVAFEDFLREPHANTDFEHFPDVTGYWVRPEANKLDMERWRERREMDWVSRQMIGKMEERFGMLSQPLTNSVAVSLGRKLLSTGALTYILDAVERPFPMHGPLGPALARTMIGWAVGPCVLFRNAYSDTERLIRVNWKVGEDELHGMHIYQSKNDEGYGQAPVEFVTADGWKVMHIAKYICAKDLTKD